MNDKRTLAQRILDLLELEPLTFNALHAALAPQPCRQDALHALYALQAEQRVLCSVGEVPRVYRRPEALARPSRAQRLRGRKAAL